MKLLLAWAVGTIAADTGRLRAEPGPPVVGALDRLDLRDAPIPPDWITGGTPKARSALHSVSADGAATTTVWDCTAGTFRWHFGWDETVLILDGEVEVTAVDGSRRTIRAGEVAFFPAGSSAVWHIPVYLRKLAFCRRRLPAPVAIALTLRDRLVRAIRGGGRGSITRL